MNVVAMWDNRREHAGDARAIYPTGCCVCACAHCARQRVRIFLGWRAHSLRYTPAQHTSVGPVSFVILPYRRFLSLSLSSFLSLAHLRHDTTRRGLSTRSRERQRERMRDVSENAVSPRRFCEKLALRKERDARYPRCARVTRRAG